MVVKAVNNFSYYDLSYICVSLSQYLEFVGKPSCAILYTYNKVFCTPVPQRFGYDTSAMGVNVFKHKIGLFTSNIKGCDVNSFPPASIHMGLSDTISTNNFIGGNICYD